MQIKIKLHVLLTIVILFKERNCQLVTMEYCGPIDGVRPIDYPDTYGILLRSICVKPIVRCWAEVVYPWRRQCMRCYRRGRFRSYLRNVGAHAFRSYLSEGESFQTVVECFFCDKELMWVRPAHNCRGCIEQFVMAKEYIDEEVNDFNSVELFIASSP